MYRLVVDVDQYPEFLPWCEHGRVVEHEENGMTGRNGHMPLAASRQTFSTRKCACA
jgi:ribosome-associated toxin RatA of RatAB toxin-antitoxin module